MNWIKGIVKFWKTIQIVLIYIVSILLVYFMFPREGKFRYEYTKNKPWMHENLVAPFDFPIFKPDQQVQRELDSLQENAHLYFFHDSLIASNMVAGFSRASSKTCLARDAATASPIPGFTSKQRSCK